MTEKRFTTDYYNFVRDDKTYIKDNDVRMTYEQIVDLLNNYSEENEQLKQRNSRQAKRLDNLYHLIEKEDWQTLKGIIQEFQECEEQLQKEWSDYE